MKGYVGNGLAQATFTLAPRLRRRLGPPSCSQQVGGGAPVLTASHLRQLAQDPFGVSNPARQALLQSQIRRLRFLQSEQERFAAQLLRERTARIEDTTKFGFWPVSLRKRAEIVSVFSPLPPGERLGVRVGKQLPDPRILPAIAIAATATKPASVG